MALVSDLLPVLDVVDDLPTGRVRAREHDVPGHPHDRVLSAERDHPGRWCLINVHRARSTAVSAAQTARMWFPGKPVEFTMAPTRALDGFGVWCRWPLPDCPGHHGPGLAGACALCDEPR